MYIMYGNASNITPFLHSRHYGHLHGMKSPPPAGGGEGVHANYQEKQSEL